MQGWAVNFIQEPTLFMWALGNINCWVYKFYSSVLLSVCTKLTHFWSTKIMWIYIADFWYHKSFFLKKNNLAFLRRKIRIHMTPCEESLWHTIHWKTERNWRHSTVVTCSAQASCSVVDAIYSTRVETLWLLTSVKLTKLQICTVQFGVHLLQIMTNSEKVNKNPNRTNI